MSGSPRLFPGLEPWRRNVYAVAIAQFIALGGGNMVFPFMPFYVEQLGVHDKGEIALWSGLLGTSTGLALFVFSPIWGNLADRYGRKRILLRAYVGAMITLTLQGAVQSVWQLVLLRALQGMFVGTIPAATALVAAGTPRQRVAWALGILQMGLFSSQFAGPLAGGLLSSTIGIRQAFFLTGGFYALSFVLVLTQVQERFERPSEAERGTFAENIGLVLSRRPLLLIIGMIFFLNAGPSFVRPVIPLMVDSFDAQLSAKTLSGIAFAALALTSAIAALASSRVSGRFGYRNALAIATLGAGAAYLPVAAANSELSLIVLIGLVGLFSGAMVPTANALVDAWAPPNKQASVFGLSGSAMALAFAVAPLTGGAVASAAGVEMSFVVIGSVMLCVGLGVIAFIREPGDQDEPARARAEVAD